MPCPLAFADQGELATMEASERARQTAGSVDDRNKLVPAEMVKLATVEIIDNFPLLILS